MLNRPDHWMIGPNQGILGDVDAIDPFPPSDPLGEALHFLRMNGAFYCRSELTAPWGLTMAPMPGYFWFHVVTSGRLWLETEEEGGAERRGPTVGELADRLGYRSEAAFSRAFKRVIGISPGAVRRAAEDRSPVLTGIAAGETPS
jgi:AraC-like DNA-binding protein